MKSPAFFSLLMLIILAVSLSGCIGGFPPGAARTTVPTPRVTTTVVEEILQTTATPVPSAPLTPAATTVPATPTPTLASSSDIRSLYDDVAYSFGYRLERLHYDPSRPRVIISTTAASDEDIALLERTAKDFNAASPTMKISENIKETGTGDLLIKYIPEKGFEAIKLDEVPENGPFSDPLTRGELFQGNVPAAKIVRGTIYINAELRGGARDHILVKSLMYEMGLTGETTEFPDSVFYAGENTNAVLTTADKKIITMLYAQGNY
jgi:hypothetical protein